MSDTERRFYVYAVAISGSVVYIGKGTGKRYKSHLRKSHNFKLASQIEAARSRGETVRSKIIRAGLTEPEALSLEGRLIKRHQERLANVKPGEGFWADRFVASCNEFLNRLKPEWIIRAEGDVDGMTVEQRLAWRNWAEDRMERLCRAVMADGQRIGQF